MPNQDGRLIRVVILIVLLAAICACSKSSDSTMGIFLDRMHQLTRTPLLTLELVRNTLEVDFAKDEKSSHDMVTFFIGRPRPGSLFKSLIKLVDCRVPTATNTAMPDPFVLVELQQSRGEQPSDADRRTAGLLRRDVIAKFGEPDVFQPALPEDQTSLGSYIYKIGSRSLWFGLSRRIPEQVTDISIHPLEDAR